LPNTGERMRRFARHPSTNPSDRTVKSAFPSKRDLFLNRRVDHVILPLYPLAFEAASHRSGASSAAGEAA